RVRHRLSRGNGYWRPGDRWKPRRKSGRLVRWRTWNLGRSRGLRRAGTRDPGGARRSGTHWRPYDPGQARPLYGAYQRTASMLFRSKWRRARSATIAATKGNGECQFQTLSVPLRPIFEHPFVGLSANGSTCKKAKSRFTSESDITSIILETGELLLQVG